MAVHVIIDGYNLIKQSATLSRFDHMDVQKGRDELLKRLVAYKKIKKHKITVVFDGHKGEHLKQEKSRDRGIDIIFSKRGEEADAVIKRMAHVMREKMLVVTSDNDIVDFSIKRGASVIPSLEFEMKMEMAFFSQIKGVEEESYTEVPQEPIHTKKKGPSKRLKKSQRRSEAKIKKL